MDDGMSSCCLCIAIYDGGPGGAGVSDRILRGKKPPAATGSAVAQCHAEESAARISPRRARRQIYITADRFKGGLIIVRLHISEAAGRERSAVQCSFFPRTSR